MVIECATAGVGKLSSQLLDSYVDKNISEICPHGYTDSSLNHCAHFVCHAASLALGTVTCSQMSAARVAGRIGVCIRVHEIFAACPSAGLFANASEAQKSAGLIVFVTSPSAVSLSAQTMTNVPKKHVGLCVGETIWHYSNTRDKVVTATPAQFRLHYQGQTNELYFGTLPATAVVAPLGCGR